MKRDVDYQWRLAELMGGTVGVHAPTDGGTAFWFRVPLTPVAPPSNL